MEAHSVKRTSVKMSKSSAWRLYGNGNQKALS